VTISPKNWGRLGCVGAWAGVVVWCGGVGCGQKAKKIRQQKRALKVPPYREKDRLPTSDDQRISYHYPELMYI